MTQPGRPAAEQIAEVVADIRAGRVLYPAAFDVPGKHVSQIALARAQQPQPVVDCTAIFRMHFRMQQEIDEINLYDDYPQVTPPWDDALLCYVNTFGNVVCLQVHRRDHDGSTPTREDWATDNEVDWPRVRWIAESIIWVGGRSGDGRPIPTSGPCHMFRHAIHEDGSSADINWVALLGRDGLGVERPDQAPGQYSFTGDEEITAAGNPTWEAILITLGASLNFLNASNIDIAEPARPRAERRRIARTGVTVQTIVVRPPGKHRARPGAARPIDAVESELSPVRGHWALYGPRYNRGLLFGKLEGKFWISQHVRGATGDAEPDPKTYVLKPRRRQGE